MRTVFLLFILIFFTSTMAGQIADVAISPSSFVAPIPLEAFATDQAINFQMIIDKKFTGQNKFGFFGVANLLNRYDNDNEKNEFMVLTMATLQIFKNVSIGGGMWSNNAIGVRPTIAVNYTHIGQNFLLVYVPRIDLTQNHNLENVVIFEYFPKLYNNWSLYNRLQALYNHNIEDHSHDRSYVYLRIGISHKKFRFGVGSNLDYYGPAQVKNFSAGLFAGTQLF